MKYSSKRWALAASVLAIASPAIGQVAPGVTVTFTESLQEGGLNPTPEVTGYGGQFTASGGLVSNVSLVNFFAETPGAFSYTYNLLEPGGGNPLEIGSGPVSDQVTFSGGGLLGTNLFLFFTSDPLNFIPTSYGSILETGGFQTIPLPPNMPGSRNTLTVMARSELEAAVPEPSTWAMMLLGFVGVGLAMRSRRRPALYQIA